MDEEVFVIFSSVPSLYGSFSRPLYDGRSFAEGRALLVSILIHEFVSRCVISVVSVLFVREETEN